MQKMFVNASRLFVNLSCVHFRTLCVCHTSSPLQFFPCNSQICGSLCDMHNMILTFILQ